MTAAEALEAAERHLKQATYLMLDQPTPIIIPLVDRAEGAKANTLAAIAYLRLAKMLR